MRSAELERVAEHGGVGRRQPGPAGESLDRQQTAALDVQHPLALAAVLEHEVAEEAGGRALGERRGGEAVEDVLAVRRPVERRRQALGNGRRPPDRVPLGFLQCAPLGFQVVHGNQHKVIEKPAQGLISRFRRQAPLP